MPDFKDRYPNLDFDTLPHDDATVEQVTEWLGNNTDSFTAHDIRAARWLLTDNSLDFARGDPLSIAFIIDVADGETARARDYLRAITDDPTSEWRQGMYAQAESRIFGYLDARGLV